MTYTRTHIITMALLLGLPRPMSAAGRRRPSSAGERHQPLNHRVDLGGLGGRVLPSSLLRRECAIMSPMWSAPFRDQHLRREMNREVRRSTGRDLVSTRAGSESSSVSWSVSGTNGKAGRAAANQCSTRIRPDRRLRSRITKYLSNSLTVEVPKRQPLRFTVLLADSSLRLSRLRA
jgi:hypothetical protein